MLPLWKAELAIRSMQFWCRIIVRRTRETGSCRVKSLVLACSIHKGTSYRRRSLWGRHLAISSVFVIPIIGKTEKDDSESVSVLPRQHRHLNSNTLIKRTISFCSSSAFGLFRSIVGSTWSVSPFCSIKVFIWMESRSFHSDSRNAIKWSSFIGRELAPCTVKFLHIYQQYCQKHVK